MLAICFKFTTDKNTSYSEIYKYFNELKTAPSLTLPKRVRECSLPLGELGKAFS